MTTPPPRSTPFAAAGVATSVVAVAAWVLALVRPWGDTGVDPDGSLVDGRPVAALAALGVAVVVAVVAAVGAARRTGRAPSARLRIVAGSVVAAVGVGAGVVVLAVVRSQVFPRDGGWWAVLGAVAVCVTGAAVVAGGPVRPAGRTGGLVATAVAIAVPVALVVVGVVVAPGWAGHVVDGAYPDSFSESPGPATVTHVGWRQEFGAGTAFAVLGGRVVVASDTGSGPDCRLTVRALDAGSGKQVWSEARPLRCDGPRLAALDGNNTTVRITLRGRTSAGAALAGAPLMLYLGTEDGREFTPSAALDAVQWWTEGFGLIDDGSSVRGLDARTGVTIWSRPVPRCTGGGAATVQVPDAVATGRLTARSPYDLAVPLGTVRVAGAGNVVVLGVSCPDDGAAARRVWLVDAVNGPDADRTVTLPGGSAATGPTTFLPWLDTVVAAVPLAAPAGGSVLASLFGVDLRTGRIAWQRAPSPLTTVDLSPTDGRVSATSVAAGDAGRTVVLDVHTGAVIADRAEQIGPQASVALTGARVGYDRQRGITVGAGTGGAAASFPLPGCVVDLSGATAPLLTGPGGVVVRCEPTGAGGASVVGLAP